MKYRKKLACVIIAALGVLYGSIGSAQADEFRIPNTQFPCNDLMVLASSAMLLRQLSYDPNDPEEAVARFALSDQERARPYVEKAFQYPQVLDDGKSRGDVVRSFAILEQVSCEAEIDSSMLDPNRHDPATGRRLN